MAYAKNLTKADLMADGITEITKEGRVFKGNTEVFPHWIANTSTGDYLAISVYERDLDGHLIKGKDRIFKYTCKDGTVKEYSSWQAKIRTIGLHRAMWAWHNEEVPDGYVVDHINNKHSRIEDYHLDNLQLLTPKENLAKERGESVKQVRCKLNRPRDYYEDKLTKYEELYKEAKANKNAELAHKMRTNVAQTRARLRYYDSHIDEVNNIKTKNELEQKENAQMTEFKKDLVELKYWKERFREAGNKTMWHQCCKVEKLAKTETKENAIIIVRHALDTLHGTFGGR